MKRILILAASALTLAACAAPVAPPICNREAIAWDKYGTPEIWEICEAPAAPLWGIFTPRETRDYDDEPRPDTPTDTPDDDTPDDEPTGKKKDDNSDANGRGGNKHNRADKDRAPQEIAENKKASR
jgi:hypothetical protein